MDGVVLTPLKQIYSQNGNVYHALKSSDPGFEGFGEAYFSTVKKGGIKGWKKHQKMILNIIVPVGEIKFVIYNEILKTFYSVCLSQKNYQRLTIEKGLWLAFKGVGDDNMLMNLASIEHSPSESISVDIKDIDYEWTSL